MRSRVSIMGVPIDKVTLETAKEQAIALLQKDKCSMIITPNTEIVMEAQKDPHLMEIIEKADLVIPDGIGLIYASKLRYRGLTQRVTGIDLMHELLAYSHKAGKRIYIFGGKPGVAELAGENIQKAFPNISIVGIRNGYFQESDEKKILEDIRQKKPDILFVALGAPKQEKWMYKYQKEIQAKIAMGVGGSVDVWAGTVKRAPQIYQKLGLEWFYRLAKEPWRYKRMLALPKFMIKVLLSKKV